MWGSRSPPIGAARRNTKAKRPRATRATARSACLRLVRLKPLCHAHRMRPFPPAGQTSRRGPVKPVCDHAWRSAEPGRGGQRLGPATIDQSFSSGGGFGTVIWLGGASGSPFGTVQTWPQRSQR